MKGNGVREDGGRKLMRLGRMETKREGASKKEKERDWEEQREREQDGDRA